MPVHAPFDPQSRAIQTHAVVRGPHRVVSVEHPAYPCIVEDVQDLGHDALATCALEYVKQVASLLDMPPEWLEDLRCNTGVFRWLDLAWDADWLHAPASKADPRSSFAVTRRPGTSGPPTDASVVLLAANVVSGDKPDVRRALHDGQGLRIVAHVHANPAGTHALRFTGASLVRLGEPLKAKLGSFGARAIDIGLFTLIRAYMERIFSSLAMSFAGARVLPGNRIVLRMNAYTGPLAAGKEGLRAEPVLGRANTAYDVEALIEPDPSNTDAYRVRFLSGTPRVAHANDLQHDRPIACGFHRDPASATGQRHRARAGRRRAEPYLCGFRADLPLERFSSTEPGGHRALEKPQWFRVVEPQPALPRRTPATLPVSPPPTEVVSATARYSIRSRAVAATHAAFQSADLFQRMTAFGLQPESYFKFARLPLWVDPRGRMSTGPGRSGKTVNAEVRFFSIGPDFWEDVDLSQRPWLSVSFALGDLARRRRSTIDRLGNVTSRRQAEYASIAMDPRWAWHEFGHVLIAAATGSLELPFVHSVGDALAAIVSDPYSRLAEHPQARYATFPWIPSARRHDRDVRRGWSWSGSFHRATRMPSLASHASRKGYISEQILSTTLFRLYRCLGGDTTFRTTNSIEPDCVQRQEASDYCLYLVKRAIALLGPASVVPAETPEQFAAALVDADIGTEGWVVDAPWPYDRAPRRLRRVGGNAHKLIRWAFEAQGLYAASPTDIVDDRGEPPSVDIYIEDRRPSARPGEYEPVSLDWGSDDAMAPPGVPTPAWSATGRGVEYDDAANAITVEVGNRGAVPASQVTLRGWFYDLGAQIDVAVLRSLHFDPASAELVTLPGLAGASAPLSPLPPAASFALPVPGPVGSTPQRCTIAAPARASTGTHYLALVEASCPDDPANTDAARTSLPSSRLPTLLPQLVSGDNNLALVVFKQSPQPA